MNENQFLSAATEALKHVLEKGVKHGVDSIAKSLPHETAAEVAIDFLGEFGGRFAGTMAVALIRQVIGVKDKLSRVDDATKQLKLGQDQIRERIDLMIDAPLRAAHEELSNMESIEPPYSHQETMYLTNRATQIIQDLSKFKNSLQSTAPSGDELQSALVIVDLICVCVLVRPGGLERVARRYRKAPLREFQTKRDELMTELNDAPRRIGEMKHQIDEYISDYKISPKVIIRIPVRPSKFVPDGDFIERTTENPSKENAARLQGRLDTLEQRLKTIHGELRVVNSWIAWLQSIGEAP